MGQDSMRFGLVPPDRFPPEGFFPRHVSVEQNGQENGEEHQRQSLKRCE
jgi:hypothetical protein